MPREGLVLAREGSTYRVGTRSGEVTAVLRGTTKRANLDRVVVGDRVLLDRPDPTGTARIAETEPRRNVLTRRTPNGRGVRPIAANLDRVLVLASVADPEPLPELIDRLLVIAETNDIPAGVVITKIDLASHADLNLRFRNAGYPIWPVSILSSLGIDALDETLTGHVTLLTGPSGVGKSSLLNRLQPGLALRTAEVSARVRRGRQTTTAAAMVALDRGGYLVDTPGFSEVGIWGVEPPALAHAFPDFRPFIDRCRFADCRHAVEPDCAVRAAVESGQIAADRHATYVRLLSELDTTPHHWE